MSSPKDPANHNSKPEKKPLNDFAIGSAKARPRPYKLTDSQGLYLEIKPSGKKFWRYRYRIAGKENLFALGEYCSSVKNPNHIALAEARFLRDEARKLVKQGIHPAHQKKLKLNVQVEANQNTFRAVADEWVYHTSKRKGWSAYYLGQVETILKTDVYPTIGTLPIDAINPRHIALILGRIESRKAFSVAILARQWCSAVFRYAIRQHKANSDPTTAFKGEISRPPVCNSKPLPLEEIPVFLNKLAGYGGHRHTVIALNLLMLTVVRTKELREAVWCEFDLGAAIWRIPAPRMKKRREHLVPLSRQAVELLIELRTLTGDRKFLFPNTRRPQEPIGATSLNRALEYMGYQGSFSCHGFRSTASTQWNELGYRADVIEVALSHSEGNAVRRAYNQAEYLTERRQMLQDWADLLDKLRASGPS